jgi:hypothetical protein
VVGNLRMTEETFRKLLYTSYRFMSRDQKRAVAILSRHELWPVTSRDMADKAKAILNVKSASSRGRAPRRGYSSATLTFVEEMIASLFRPTQRAPSWTDF